MANEEQLEILRLGVKDWNIWRIENSDIQIDLKYVDLAGLRLRRIDLTGANLSGASFKATDLQGAKLIRADFSNATFFSANLMDTYLRQANFSGAFFGSTIFGNLDLGQSIGLESAKHVGPSTISTDTFARSNGKIPEMFLRGCGLSDWEIENVKLYQSGLNAKQVIEIAYRTSELHIGYGIQYYSCFISYSSKDQEFAKQLHNDLQNNGVRCWFAPEDMKIGDQIRPRIDQEIQVRDKLLVILSHNSVKSEWVGDEVEAALEEESKNNRLVLFPIRLDDAVMSTRDDWAAKIKRRRHIGDFSNWKDKASYQKAFERLLRDLKATGGGGNGE